MALIAIQAGERVIRELLCLNMALHEGDTEWIYSLPLRAWKYAVGDAQWQSSGQWRSPWASRSLA